LIGERELRLYRLFSLRRNGKSFPHPIDRSRRCVALSDGRGAFEQRGDFAQLLAEFLFSGHRNRQRAKAGSKICVLRNKEFYCSASLRASGSHNIDSIDLRSAESERGAEERRAILKVTAKSCDLPSVAPQDLPSGARLCHHAGGELEQIQFLLGHVSIQTMERYLGCKQRFRNAVNDHIGMEPDVPS
jgi:hypothetical protein